MKVLPPGTQLRNYVVGRAHARLSTGAIVGMAVFALAFVVALLAGYIILPGGLFLIYVVYAVRPPRGVAVSEQGLAVLARSFWTGRPNKVLALLPPAPMASPTASGSVTVELGAERITFSRNEFRVLAEATAGMVPPAGYAPGAPGGFPGGPSVTPQPFPSPGAAFDPAAGTTLPSFPAPPPSPS